MKHKMQRAIRKVLVEFPWHNYGLDHVDQVLHQERPEIEWANDLSRRIAELFIGDDDPWYDMISMRGNLLLKTHAETVCQGQTCCIHNPSDHHMSGWDQQWDPQAEVMYRICEHESLHPDPDDIYVRANRGMVSHPCDGCCDPNHPGTVVVAEIS